MGKNNSILDGATISTDKVILVENGTQKTYTFPVKRESKNSGLENLVVKQNADDTFSGVLIQYDITPLEKDLFVLGEEIDMKNKIKIFDINNLSISQKVVTEAIGCYEITWENGVCASSDQHVYGDKSCNLTGSQAASAPAIISIVNTCSGGAGGTDTGIPSYPNPDSPGGNTGGYGTLPYSDDSDLMLAKYQQFSNIFHINTYNFTSTLRTKLFYLYLYQYEDQYTVSKLLTYFGTKPDILNNTVDMFTENASLSWDDFYNQFLATQCEKLKNLLAKTDVQAKITELKNQSTLGGEKGVKFKVDGTPSETISGGAHNVNFGDKTGYAGGYHNHTPTGISMLSPPDIDQLLGFARAQPTSNPANVNNAYVGMVAPNGMHYVIWFNGIYDDAIKNYSQEQLDEYTDRYQTRYGMYKPSSGDMSNEAIEKFFFKALTDMGLDGKINLQRVENDGTVKMIIKNNDGTTTAIPCS
ncbi:hypothetical protein [Chryseobacterium candidae]|uniref:Baseplate wedge subunit n=1 Tax=Chryseobacterium candidae TaxID=1978493 RepID=A0ABY2R647_9FLAO|nr:hypothetical protein [Chryseobacterium candidae]THV56792.1 hypothetical protein EK417_17435 [Chryseobacterium candidae]